MPLVYFSQSGQRSGSRESQGLWGVVPGLSSVQHPSATRTGQGSSLAVLPSQGFLFHFKHDSAV